MGEDADLHREDRRVRLRSSFGQGRKVGFINFVIDVTPECDRLPRSDAPIVSDVGISSSEDPVVIDAASFELVNDQQGLTGSALQSHPGKGEYKFRGLWPKWTGADR